MTMPLTPVSDDQLRSALLREPSAGLGEIVADRIAREVATSPQRRRGFLRWPWTGAEPRIGYGPGIRRVVWAAVFVAIVAGLIISIAVIGAFLRRPTPFRNGSIAFAPPEGGVTVVDGRAGGHWSDTPALFVSWSPDGSRLAFWSGVSTAHLTPDPTTGEWELRVLDPRSGALTTGWTPTGSATIEPNGPIQWSNDGRRITASVLADGFPEAVIADLQTGTASRVGPTDMDEMLPTWSPAGDRLAFVAERRFSSGWRLYLADADGAHPVEQSLAFPTGFQIAEHQGQPGMAMQTAYPLAWSPDGTRILVTATSDSGAATTFTYRVSDGSLTALTPATVNPSLSRWSPDGSSVAFLSFDDQRQLSDLYVIGADGSGLRRVSSDACEFVAWSPDGSRLLFDAGLCNSIDTTIEVRTVLIDGSGLQTVWSESLPLTGQAESTVSVGWQGLQP
jgi:Tol biopolymer transport system component